MDPTLKRPRRTSTSSSGSSASSSSNPKLLRPSTPSTDSNNYTCTLGPTCSDSNPRQFSTLASYQDHYSTFHTHVCQSTPSPYEFAQRTDKGKGKQNEEDEQVCGRIFPNERLLDLHLRECHDPVTQLRQQRGEKTFECLHSSSATGDCRHLFSNPKNRRLHMISSHGYPKEWFFAVVIWGIGQLLLPNSDSDQGGLHHGMLRKDWKPRAGQPGYAEEKEEKEEVREDKEMEELTKGLEGSSIGFVPRSVGKKNKVKSKMSIESA
ncbi:uncharacterized protein JCM6883_005627 [Sporobolomyces salmoneus]|uniref:uncharacterized protein n=1 Tax=Sporobolomyces salmoneus TaxID=183962 RepID=UPI0031735863